MCRSRLMTAADIAPERRSQGAMHGEVGPNGACRALPKGLANDDAGEAVIAFVLGLLVRGDARHLQVVIWPNGLATAAIGRRRRAEGDAPVGHRQAHRCPMAARRTDIEWCGHLEGTRPRASDNQSAPGYGAATSIDGVWTRP